jgi:hypothetical protein
MSDSKLHIRSLLKIIRDRTKTAYDTLPSGETLGEVANKEAIAQYSRKIKRKRERARESRSLKKMKNTENKKPKDPP